jgi:hypothetical protein
MATHHQGDAGVSDDLRERPVSELLSRLSEETTRLVHQELDLAKAELSAKGRQAGAGAGLVGAAGALGLAALGALTACFILALNAVMPAGLAALIVTAVYGVIAAVLGLRGRARIMQAAPPIPEQTIETVKEDVKWGKTQMPSARK